MFCGLLREEEEFHQNSSMLISQFVIYFTLITLLYLLDNVTYLVLLQWFLQGLGITGRPLFQVLICVECYLAVVHPVTFLKYKPLRYRVICCTVVWIIALGSFLGIMSILRSLNLKAYTWFFSLQFLLFLSVQLFCLVAVLRALKQSGPGERGRKREEENHIKRRAFHLILITAVTFIAMFAPFIFTGLLTVLEHINRMRFHFSDFLVIVVLFWLVFVQPVLYLYQAGKLFCLCSS